MKIRKDDKVVVLSGRDKGKEGKVLSVDPKAGKAIVEGVRRVFVIDGRIPHSILIETLTDEGIGTMFWEGAENE